MCFLLTVTLLSWLVKKQRDPRLPLQPFSAVLYPLAPSKMSEVTQYPEVDLDLYYSA